MSAGARDRDAEHREQLVELRRWCEAEVRTKHKIYGNDFERERGGGEGGRKEAGRQEGREGQ